jgi:MSHA pilin protein MshD
MKLHSPGNKMAGVTLVELIMAIVVVGVAFAGMMAAYASMVGRSADPMVYQQAIAIADSFLEEISAKDYPASFSGNCPASPGNRTLFDDVCDYAGYTSSNLTDIAGNVLGISGYQVAIAVTAAGGQLGIAANDALLVTVSVTHPLGSTLSLSTYRVRF